METACSGLLITTKYIITKLCQCISLVNLPNSKCEPSSNTCTCESQAPQYVRRGFTSVLFKEGDHYDCLCD